MPVIFGKMIFAKWSVQANPTQVVSKSMGKSSPKQTKDIYLYKRITTMILARSVRGLGDLITGGDKEPELIYVL